MEGGFFFSDRAISLIIINASFVRGSIDMRVASGFFGRVEKSLSSRSQPPRGD